VTKSDRFLDAGTRGILTLENGDCFRDPARNADFGEHSLNAVECVGADNEVYVFARLTGTGWDRAAIAAQAWKECGTTFADLWGGSSGFAYFPALPTERSWTTNRDRTAMCVVYSPDGPLTVDPLDRVATA
jgi:hypothetical protein